MESKMGCLKGNNVRKNIKGGEDDGKGGHDRERVPAAFYHVDLSQHRCHPLRTCAWQALYKMLPGCSEGSKAAYRYPECHTYDSMMKSGRSTSFVNIKHCT